MTQESRPFWKRLRKNPLADTMVIGSLISRGVALERTIAAGINYSHGNSGLADLCMEQASNAALVSGLVSPGLLKAGAMLRNPAWLVPYTFRAATTAMGITNPNINILDTTILDYAVYSVFGQAAMSTAVENKQAGKLEIDPETPVFKTLALLINTTEGKQAIRDTIAYPIKATMTVAKDCWDHGFINYTKAKLFDRNAAADPEFNYMARIAHHTAVASLYFGAEATNSPVMNAAALGLTISDVVTNLTIDRKEAKALDNKLMNWKNNLEIVGAFKRVPFFQQNEAANILFYAINSMTMVSSGLANTLWLKDKEQLSEYLGIKHLKNNPDHRQLALTTATGGMIMAGLIGDHSPALDALTLGCGFALMLDQHATAAKDGESYGELYLRSRREVCEFPDEEQSR